MKFSISREALLKTLQMVAGVVERKQSANDSILGNVLLQVYSHQLCLTGTDQNIELVGRSVLEQPAETGETTVSAKRLMEICRAMPDDAVLSVHIDGAKCHITSGRARFNLATLPSEKFPRLKDEPGQLEFSLPQQSLHDLFELSAFAIAQQDISRPFLEGLLFEVKQGELSCVGCNGHRLAIAQHKLSSLSSELTARIIIPRKTVLELQKLLDDGEANVDLTIGERHLRANCGPFTLTSTLINATYADYNMLIPKGLSHVLEIEREALQKSLSRVSILLSDEKRRIIGLQPEAQQLQISATNSEQEEASEEIAAKYQGESFQIHFNVSYLNDVLNSLKSEKVRMSFSGESKGSALIEAVDGDQQSSTSLHVIVPCSL